MSAPGTEDGEPTAEELLDRGDAIGALCKFVRDAGLTMTLHGQPIDETGLRAAADERVRQRIARILVPAATLQFSDDPCGRCGWRHQVDAFEPKVDVVVLESNRPRYRAGERGRVIEWRAWPGSSVWVRVEFPDGERENFDPCELEHA